MDRLKQTVGKCKILTSVNSHCFQNDVTFLLLFFAPNECRETILGSTDPLHNVCIYVCVPR